jgi:ADP-heptose:LPS heptosyltransferase
MNGVGKFMRILLSRLDRIGDLVLSTPAIASVRRSWPHAHITLVCSTYNSVVVQGGTDVDEVIAIAPGVRSERVGQRFRHSCDLAIALAPCTSDLALVGATKAPRRIGYTYLRRYVTRLSAFFLLTDLLVSEADPSLCERDPGYRVRHEVDQVLALVERAGGSRLHRDLVLPITEADRIAVAHIPADGISVHAGVRWFRDGSTFASFIALLTALRCFKRKIIVTYGDDARVHARGIEESGVADVLIGSLSLTQWAAIFERSALVVTVDTGAIHIASAMKRPTVVLFEHRYFNLSSQEWAPYRVPAVLVRKPADERPESLEASREALVAGVERLLMEKNANDGHA